MTQDKLLPTIAALLSTLLETEGAPASTLYLGLGMDLDWYQTVIDIMTKAGLVTVKGHYVTLTEVGKDKARQVNAIAYSKVIRAGI